MSRVGRSRLANRMASGQLLDRLERAGSPWTRDFALGLKVVLSIVAALGSLVGVIVTPLTLLFAPVTVLAAFRLTDIAMARAAKVRHTGMANQIPDLADLLLVMTEAGISPAMAFRRAADALPGPLGHEVYAVVRRLDLGVPWRVALDDVAHRAGVPAFTRLARTLARSQRLGTSLSSVLRNLAGELRRERRAEAEAAARKAPVKMLFPLVFLILPAFLLLTVGPLVLSTLRSLR
ncbi:MAG TPA: type II secretion system F family protein [Actinomycetota bacterium]